MLANFSRLILHLRPVIFFALLSTLIIFGWFKQGLYYGGAEVGISPYYDPARILNIIRFIWWGDVAPGMLVPQFVSAVPLYFLLSLLQGILSPLSLQIFLFFGLIFLTGYGMYSFCLLLIGQEKKNYAIIAGLFYILNSYTMVEVWHRFLYTGFFLTAFLPILALLWKIWISKGRVIYLTLFLLTNLVASYMFGNLTSMLVVWLLFLMMGIAEVAFPWQGKAYLLKVFQRFIFGFLLFLVTNLWWLIPVFTVSIGVLPEQHSSEDNISTLLNISKQSILPFTLQYANPFYLFYRQELGQIYTNFIYLILAWIPMVVIFVGLLYSFRKKLLARLGLFYLITILIVKGAAQPFGYPYIWAFMNIYALGVIRNPFEKLGVLLPFFGSILFILGLETILFWGTKKIGSFFSKLILISVLISVLSYASPMFTGMVFNKPDYPLNVKVPHSYEQADGWFRLQKNAQGNILHLPFPDHDVVTYNWENGYHGVEINEILFTALPSITRNVGIKRVDDTLKSLSFIFNKPFSEDKNQILRVLQSLNVQYIILHKDTRWADSATYGKDIGLVNPNQIEDTLNSLNILEKSVTFGDLLIYKLKDDFYIPKIVLSGNSNDLVYPGESNTLQTLTFSQNMNQITPIEKELDQEIIPNLSKVIIFPEKVLYNWEPSLKTLDEIVNKSLLNSKDESSPFTQLSEVKQTFFTQTGELLSETLITKIIEASSNLIDLTHQDTLDSYNNLIDDIFTKGFNGSSLQRVAKQLLTKVFTLHLYMLEKFSESAKPEDKLRVMKIYAKLNSYLIKNDVLPNFRLDKNIIEGESQRRVHRYNIPLKANYELLITNPDSLSLYPNILSKLKVQLDGKNIAVKISREENSINLGQMELDKGVHEVSYEVVPSINLLPDLDKFIFLGNSKLIENNIRLETNQQGGGAVKTALPSIAGGDSYEVTFEATADNLREFYIQIVEDIQDQNNPYDCSKVSCFSIKPKPQFTGWQSFSLAIGPLNSATRNATFQILLPAMINSSTNPSRLLIRNLRLNRIMDNNLVLRKKLQEKEIIATSSGKVSEVKKISPVLYEGKIKLEKSAFLFFKETFNPKWKLTLTNRDNSLSVNKHYLGNLYGNVYFINSPGEYDFRLEFEPQKTVNNGIIASIISWIGILGILIYSEFRRNR